MHVTVAWRAQGDGLSGVAPLELLPTLPPTLHPPGVRAGQEVMAGEAALPNVPATQSTSPLSIWFEVLVAWRHS
jgi:hypothetical protein